MQRSTRSIGSRLAVQMLVCALALLGALSDAAGQVPPDRVDPRHPAMVELPEVGRMIGTIRRSVKSQWAEEYGKEVYAIGDCNGDGLSDWCVSRQRCDTTFPTVTNSARTPEEVLLYHGVRGGLPKVEEGIRIGPSELNAQTRFLASGYWDDDPYKDLCVAISIIGDTSNGNAAIGYDLWRIVVFWGQPDGVYTLVDTTHLEAIDDVWLGAYVGFSGDFDGSGRESLLLRAGGGLIAGQWLPTAKLHVFQHSNVRWGRWGGGRHASWSWWVPPKLAQIQLVDQDHDGYTDIALHYSSDGATRGEVSVLYGNGNGLPDTSEVEHLDLTVNNGAVSLFGDLTGDGVPELWVNSGSENILRVYAGRRGQRLLEQYGTGNEGVSEGKGWWRRPWAEIWLPAKLDDGWGISGFAPMFDLGDCNLDGVPDYWMRHVPTIISYVAGNAFDSLIDAMVITPGTHITGAVNLGEIDGSGKQTIAISYDYYPHAYQEPFPGGVIFVQGTTDVPVTGWYRATPDEASGVVGDDGLKYDFEVRAMPNPGSGEVQIRWNRDRIRGDVELCVSDVLGREVLSRRVPGSDGGMIWQTVGVVPGFYWIGIHDDDHSDTIRLLIR